MCTQSEVRAGLPYTARMFPGKPNRAAAIVVLWLVSAAVPLAAAEPLPQRPNDDNGWPEA